MYELRLGNGSILLTSKAALEKVEEVARTGDFWVYIAQLIEIDVSGSVKNEQLDEILLLLKNNSITVGVGSDKAPFVPTIAPVAEKFQREDTIEPIKVSSVGSGMSALERMKKFKGSKKG